MMLPQELDFYDMVDRSELTPTMRLRTVDKATNNVTVRIVLEQFWAAPMGADIAGEWIEVPHAGHALDAPRNTLA